LSAIAFHLGVGRRAASPGERVGAREEGGERGREREKEQSTIGKASWDDKTPNGGKEGW